MFFISRDGKQTVKLDLSDDSTSLLLMNNYPQNNAIRCMVMDSNGHVIASSDINNVILRIAFINNDSGGFIKLKSTLSDYKARLDSIQADHRVDEASLEAMELMLEPRHLDTRLEVAQASVEVMKLRLQLHEEKESRQPELTTQKLADQACTKVHVAILAGNPSNDADGFMDHKNPLKATFASPYKVCLDNDDNIFIVDEDNYRIRRIDCKSGEVTSIAGNGQSTIIDGIGDRASFEYPSSIVWDPKSKSLFVGDDGSIRKITLGQSPEGKIQGEVITVTGSLERGCIDRDGKTARFEHIQSLTLEDSEYRDTEWMNHIMNLEYFMLWPPGVLDIVLMFLPTFVSLLLTGTFSDEDNHFIRRVLITS